MNTEVQITLDSSSVFDMFNLYDAYNESLKEPNKDFEKLVFVYPCSVIIVSHKFGGTYFYNKDFPNKKYPCTNISTFCESVVRFKKDLKGYNYNGTLI